MRVEQYKVETIGLILLSVRGFVKPFWSNGNFAVDFSSVVAEVFNQLGIDVCSLSHDNIINR